ncbi:MAG: thioesterase domain-containing protein [Bacillota bacterium]|nr:thioesterase domain-containing protein [Bacillota bacterium]
MNKIKLFCIPYAGGSGNVYLPWKSLLSGSIELCPIELAGRGRRFNSDFYQTLEEAVEDISDVILSEVEECEYAIFGHSMGALLAYEVYYSLIKKGLKKPKHIFFSGRKAPQIENDKIKRYKLPDEEFIKVVYKYGGNTKEVFQNKELMDLFIPILRSDFRIVEDYEFKEKNEKIQTNMTTFYGSNDEGASYSKIMPWKVHAEKNFNVIEFNGGHFFVNEFAEEVVHVINKELLQTNSCD